MQQGTDEPGYAGRRREAAHRDTDSQSGSEPLPDDDGEAATRHAGDAKFEALSDRRRQAFRTVQYRRTVPATSSRAFDAIVGAVEMLGYPRKEAAPAAAEVRFSALRRTVIARAVAADEARSTVVVEFTSLSWMGIGNSALVILPGVLLGALVNAQDAYFAKGFLENVQRVLEGKRVGRDSARLPGMNALRGMLEIAEH